MSITKTLIDQDSTLVTKPEPTNDNYFMFNTGGVEVEVGEFLYGLVRMIKPEKVLETGTHKGISSSYIASALKHNGSGKLTTIEFDESLAEESFNRLRRLSLLEIVEIVKLPSLEYKTEDMFDFVLLDTEPDIRFKEFVKFWNNVKPGGIIIIHDLHPHLGQTEITAHGMAHWPFGDFKKYFGDKILDHELQVTSFPTPRGITMFQKIRNDFSANKLLKGQL